MIVDLYDAIDRMLWAIVAWIAVAAALLLTGYLIGRVRPWDRLDTWVWRRVTFGGTWTESKWQCYLTFWVHAVVRPVQTWHAWRHRNDPPPPRSPAVQIRSVSRTDDEEA